MLQPLKLKPSGIAVFNKILIVQKIKSPSKWRAFCTLFGTKCKFLWWESTFKTSVFLQLFESFTFVII